MLFPAYSVNARRTPAAPSLDLSTGGTFARALAAYYYTAVDTLASATSGTRRIENKGDGLGAGLLMEKASTNSAHDSRALNGGSWQTGGPGASVTAGDANGPDGATNTADRVQAPLTYSTYLGPFSPGNGTVYAFSFWARRRTGAGSDECHFALQDGASGTFVNDAMSETWARHSAVRVIASSGTVYCVPGEGRTTGGLTTRSLDYDVDLVQFEQSRYPTSPIDTSGSDVTRPADTLSYASGAYPAGFLTSGMVIVFAPDASSAEIIAAGETWTLAQNGAAATLNGVYLVVSGGVLYARLSRGFALTPIDQALTFSRGQAITITAKPSAGSLTVAGATTGNGTATGTGGAWTAAQTLYVGGNDSGANNVTGRFVGSSIVEAV